MDEEEHGSLVEVGKAAAPQHVMASVLDQVNTMIERVTVILVTARK